MWGCGDEEMTEGKSKNKGCDDKTLLILYLIFEIRRRNRRQVIPKNHFESIRRARDMNKSNDLHFPFWNSLRFLRFFKNSKVLRKGITRKRLFDIGKWNLFLRVFVLTWRIRNRWFLWNSYVTRAFPGVCTEWLIIFTIRFGWKQANKRNFWHLETAI